MVDKYSVEGLKASMDTSKQVITLSTGVIALTVTFLEKIVQPSMPSGVARTVPWTMFAAWVAFGIAALAGTMTLAAIAGTLNAIDRKLNGLSNSEIDEKAVDAMLAGSNIRIPGYVMMLSFIGGMMLTIATGFLR